MRGGGLFVLLRIVDEFSLVVFIPRYFWFFRTVDCSNVSQDIRFCSLRRLYPGFFRRRASWCEDSRRVFNVRLSDLCRCLFVVVILQLCRPMARTSVEFFCVLLSALLSLHSSRLSSALASHGFSCRYPSCHRYHPYGEPPRFVVADICVMDIPVTAALAS